MAVTYQPQYRVTGTTSWTAFGSPISTTAVTITGLAQGTQYDFEILALDSGLQTPSAVYTVFTMRGAVETSEATIITTAGPIVYASQTTGVAAPNGPFNTFVLVTSTADPPFVISENGGTAVGGNVLSLVYHNHTLWQHAGVTGSFDGWWYWNTGTSAYVYYAISSVALSNSTVAANSPAGTVVGTLSTVMSDSSAFVGTYSVSDTTNFKIVGTSLETNVANLSGSFTPTITATPTLVGDAYTTPSGQISITAGVAAFPNNPPAQVPSGWSLRFFDDFTTNTIDPTAGVTTLQTGINWYSSHSAGMSDPTNYHLETGTHASGIANGDNGTGGTNASPNGGIVRIYGTPPSVQQNQSTFQGIPQALIASGYQGSQVYGPTGYFEAYMQYNPALGTEHIGFWWNPNILNSSLQATECDVVEQGAASFGNSNWQLGQLNQWTGNSPNSVDFPYTSLNDTVASDAQWHTFGMLINYNSGSTTVGTMSIYFDNVLKGSITVGAGTGYPSIFYAKRILLAGKNWGAGTGNAIIFDWFRYWGP